MVKYIHLPIQTCDGNHKLKHTDNDHKMLFCLSFPFHKECMFSNEKDKVQLYLELEDIPSR